MMRHRRPTPPLLAPTGPTGNMPPLARAGVPAPHGGLMPTDRDIVRDLAKRVRRIAHDPVNVERRRLWLKHNSLQGERPMVLAETGGVMGEIMAAGWPVRIQSTSCIMSSYTWRSPIWPCAPHQWGMASTGWVRSTSPNLVAMTLPPVP